MIYQLVVLPTYALFGFICWYVVFVIVRNYYCLYKFRKNTPWIPLAPDWTVFGGHTRLWCKMGNVKLIYKCHQKLGKTFAFFVNHRPIVVTIDADLVKKYAFDEKGDHIVRPPLLSSIKQFESDSIFMASGDQLSRLRSTYAAAVTNHKIKSPYVTEQIKTSVQKLVDSFDWRLKHHGSGKNGELSLEIELDDLISRYTVDLAFSTLHKQTNLVDFNSKSSKLVQGSMRASTNFIDWNQDFYVMFPLVNPILYETSKILEPMMHYFVNIYEKSAKEAADLNHDVRKQYEEEKKEVNNYTDLRDFKKLNEFVMKNGRVFKRGLMDFAIDRVYEKTITFNEYMNSTFFLHNALERTSSDLIVHIIVNLTFHQKCQEKVRESILIDGEKSQYLVWFILETIRLMPPVPGGIWRRLEHDVATSDGQSLPKGTLLTCMPYSYHRVKQLWGENAEEFEPERWSNEKDFLPHQFVGFGAGKRSCLGRDFAMAHIKLLLVSLLTKFKFDISPKTDHHNDFGSPFHVYLVSEKPYFVMLRNISA